MAADFEMYSGDSRIIDVAITDEAGTPVDVSTATAISYIFYKSGETLFTKTLSAGITVATSTVTVTIDPEDTEDLAGDVIHEMQITTAGGGIYTVLQGTVKIIRDYIE